MDLLNNPKYMKSSRNSPEPLYRINLKDTDLERNVCIEVEGEDNFRHIYRWVSKLDWIKVTMIEKENKAGTDYDRVNKKDYPSLRGKVVDLDMSDLLKYISWLQRY